MNALQPRFQTTRLATNQTANDIVKGIGIAVKDSRPAAAIVAKQFYDKDPVKAAEKLFDFMKDPRNIEYVRESAAKQTVKSIPRILHDMKGDCKHYTIFSQGVLTALGIPNYIKLISQKKHDKDPTHVYTVAVIDGKKYVIDPCEDYFNQECSYTYWCTLRQRDMSLTYLSGTNDSEMGARKKRSGGFRNKVKTAFQNSKVQKTVGKTNGQIKKNFNKVVQQHQQELQKAGKAVRSLPKNALTAVIPQRVAKAAFLKAIGVNLNNFASRLATEYRKDPAAVKKFWAPFGKWEELRDAINRGNKMGAKISGDESGGSSDYAQYAEATKESMTMIQKLIEWFRSRKQNKEGDEKVVEDMREMILTDPEIPKVDGEGNNVSQQQIANDPMLQPAGGSTTNLPATQEEGQPPSLDAGSFGISEIKDLDSFILWLRASMTFMFAAQFIPVLAYVMPWIILASLVYLTRKYFGYKGANRAGAEAGSSGQ